MKKLSLILLVALVAFVAACSTISTNKVETKENPAVNVDYDLSTVSNW